jgi:uncharacterized membrane protein
MNVSISSYVIYMCACVCISVCSISPFAEDSSEGIPGGVTWLVVGILLIVLMLIVTIILIVLLVRWRAKVRNMKAGGGGDIREV